MKTLKLTIGGSEKTFEFGKMWFLKFYGQATGSDPLNSTEIELKPEKQFDFTVNTLYAGLQTQYKVEGRAFDFTKEDVENWVGCEDSDFIVTFIEKFSAINKVEEPGEAAAPASGA